MKNAYHSGARASIAILAAAALLALVTACSSDDGQEGLAAPTNLAATAVSSSGIALSWTDASARAAAGGRSRSAIMDSGFRVERSVTSSSEGFSLRIFTEETTFNDTGLSEGTQYWYRVRAFDQEGSSDWSAVVTATTLPAP